MTLSADAADPRSVMPGASGSLRERALLYAAQHHDPRAREQLLERFGPLLDAAVHGLRLPHGLEREDVAQEARVAFLRAVARWRPERGPFAPFARTCVRNSLVNALDRAGAHKHQLLSRALDINGLDFTDPRTRQPLRTPTSRRPDPALLTPGQGGDPEAVVLAREHLEALRVAMRSLTVWEQAALKDTLNGAPRRQIALRHGKTDRAVTLAVRRARHKLARQTAWAQTG